MPATAEPYPPRRREARRALRIQPDVRSLVLVSSHRFAGKEYAVNGHSTLRFRADPSLFGAVRRFTAQTVMLSGGSDEDARELELATGEILTNAYRHAYRRTHGPLQVDLMFDDQKVEISIHDDGEVFVGPRNIPSAIGTADEHRGLYLVGKITDHAEIVHPRNARGGTTVRMIKRISKFRGFADRLRIGTGLRGYAEMKA